MGIGISLVLIAIGAILAYAVEVEVQGINLTTVGVILMIVGGIGAVLSLLFWSAFGAARTQRRIHRGEGPDGRVVEERYDRI